LRICFLTHYYPPEVGAPQARISALAQGLASSGLEVTVHTGFPHYPDGRIKRPYRNRPHQVEEQDAVRVVRTAVYPAPNRGFSRRLLNHLSLCASALAGMRLTGPQDVIVAESPPLFTAGAAVAYARAKRAALVVNVADRWPASAVELGALSSRPAIAAAEWLENYVYRRAAAVTVPTDGLVAALDAVPSAHGRVLRLGPSVDAELFRPDPPAPSGPLRVLYAGTIGMAQGVDTLLDAARLAGPEVMDLTIAGDGHDANLVRRRLAAGEIPNARMVGAVPHAEIPSLYAQADVAAVLLRDLPIFQGALPTKLLEAMAAGRAVALSARGESAALVEEVGAGIVVPPEDPGALAEAIRSLAGDPERVRKLGDAGRRAVMDRFSRPLVTRRWRDLLESLAGPRPARG
jgi:glycosyltransferase involved in cell wall biosynthesis